MLNYLWSGMILIGVLWGAFHGQLAAVTEGALTSAKEAVTLCITMLGVMTCGPACWEVGKRAWSSSDQLSAAASGAALSVPPPLPRERGGPNRFP